MMSHSIKMLREPPLRNTKTPPTPQAEQKHKVKRGGQYEDRHHTVRREAASEGHPRVISAQPSPGLVSSNTTHSTETLCSHSFYHAKQSVRFKLHLLKYVSLFLHLFICSNYDSFRPTNIGTRKR